MATIGLLKKTCLIGGMPVELYSADVEVDVRSTITGKYVDARTYGDPNDCYEAEYPKVQIDSVVTTADVPMCDAEGDAHFDILAGTEIYAYLSDAQIEELAIDELDSAASANDAAREAYYEGEAA